MRTAILLFMNDGVTRMDIAKLFNLQLIQIMRYIGRTV